MENNCLNLLNLLKVILILTDMAYHLENKINYLMKVLMKGLLNLMV